MLKFDFHISRAAREKYKIDKSLFSITGNLIVSDYQQARILAEKINSKRKEEGLTDYFVTAGQINALGLLHEIFHLLIRKYEEEDNPRVFRKVIDQLTIELTQSDLDKTLLAFADEFPPLPVYNNDITATEYLRDKTGEKPNSEIILEELILLHFENSNPASANLRELYADDNLVVKSKYKKLIEKTEEFFEKEIPSRLGGLHLFKLLKKPISLNPNDLEKQLDFIRTEWGIYLDKDILSKLLLGVDFLREDYKLFVSHGGGEKGTPPVPSYDHELEKLRLIKEKLAAEKNLSKTEKHFYLEYEKFTEDTHWIPEVVMIAKNVFVWMHQLSEKYKREIKRLDQIPDEELEQLTQWNFNALWLIGIWERSSASKKIKHLTGNISAVSSAYSLYDYVIANELGGEHAFQNLKDRAWVRGIRLASDMVPNHTGIYSKWVIEKSDYFLQRNEPPYPNYTFTGPNLSEDERVEIKIEDKYYERKDAAVVFQRRDSYTGDVKYIYHGNDGTNMPWNDTAQLNLLIPEVKESLIQMIMHVARKTPIIRFDAAMTLAKKHYQRLWFPAPGSGGAIPSRTDYSMTLEQFNSLFPNEFWRDVVDRINSEMPNVLLLAEAFWLMEGYFVRTLGMHRVYNSAFMHMMMKEENKKYRQLIINTLEFNPEILKRYVNFMSNPDEETAVNQFGKGDKYFGVAVMMLTMPGLPMFGHGQIEGFSEKYGMEYKQAYYNEIPDEHLVWRHNKEIFPLMKMRHLFSQVENFEFYDFYERSGKVSHNVFAFSNRAGNESILVLYNNSYYETEGYIQYSCYRTNKGTNKNLNRPRKLFEILNFEPKLNYFYSYTDHRTQLQYLLSGKEIAEDGFKVHLFGYQYRVCLNFKEIYDEDGRYEKLYLQLNGKGISSIDEALKEMDLLPIHSAVEEIFSQVNLENFREFLIKKEKKGNIKNNEINFISELTPAYKNLNEQLNEFIGIKISKSKSIKELLLDLSFAHKFYQILLKYNNRRNVTKWMQHADSILPVNSNPEIDHRLATLLIVSVFKNSFGTVSNKINVEKTFNELLLFKPISRILEKASPDVNAHLNNELIKIMLTLYSQKPPRKRATSSNKSEKTSKKEKKRSNLVAGLNVLLDSTVVHNFLHVNKFEGSTYFNKENFNELTTWLLLVTQLNKRENVDLTDEKSILRNLKSLTSETDSIINEAQNSGYDLTKLKEKILKIDKPPKSNKKIAREKRAGKSKNK
ncbi:MAG: alpha-amylase [Ignavibacteria bacterium]|nr:alpha-amylase [Ignavibacteria bacterium]NNL21741.1 alpha-amylase [Ignavibacteriaceae bacterium]